MGEGKGVMQMARDLGERVRELREQAGYSAAELGRVVGISQSQISRVENGKQMPLYTLLMELADALGTTPDDLLIAEALLDARSSPRPAPRR